MDSKLKVKILILPKFGSIDTDSINDEKKVFGETQSFYEAYLKGGNKYNIKGCVNPFYYKDGIALIVTGEGKVNAATTLASVLSDDRFDFEDTYILDTGCAGGCDERVVLGDVMLIDGTCDFDIGHTVDSTELDNRSVTWFKDPSFESFAHYDLNNNLINSLYEQVRDTLLDTTENTKKYMITNYDNADWAGRNPKVVVGTTVTSDNYWKGKVELKRADYIVKSYDMRSPFICSEMEDNAIATVCHRFGLLNKLIILRYVVNMISFQKGVTPDIFWGVSENVSWSEKEDSVADIFDTAANNNIKIAKIIINSLINK